MLKLLAPLSLVLSLVALSVVLFRPEPEPPLAIEQPKPHVTVDLEPRVRAMEVAIDSMSRRVRALELAATADGGVLPVAATTGLEAELSELKTQMRDLSAGMALDTEEGKATMKELIKSVQQESFQERQQARAEQFANTIASAQTERLEKWKQFVTDASLNYTQEQQLLQRIQQEAQQAQQLAEQVKSGELQPREMRQQLRSTREETDALMKQSLSAEQLQKYGELRESERPRGPGRQGGQGGQFGAQQQ